MTWEKSRATSRTLELDYTGARTEKEVRDRALEVMQGTYPIINDQTTVPVLKRYAVTVHVPNEGSAWARRMVVEEQLREGIALLTGSSAARANGAIAARRLSRPS